MSAYKLNPDIGDATVHSMEVWAERQTDEVRKVVGSLHADLRFAVEVAKTVSDDRKRLIAEVERLRDRLATAGKASTLWHAYATAWEHWADGRQVHQPKREKYGL